MLSETLFTFKRMNNLLIGTSKSLAATDGHSFVAYQNSLYKFGGKNLDTRIVYNDLIQYEVVNQFWRLVVPDDGIKPSGIYDHSAVVYKSSMFVYGGKNQQGQFTHQLLEYHFPTNEWSVLEFTKCDLPEPSSAHIATLYTDQLLLLLPGQPETNQKNDLRQMRLFGTNNWEQVKQRGAFPIQCVQFCTAVVVQDQMYLLLNSGKIQLFLYNFKGNEWSQLEDPPLTKMTGEIVNFDHKLFVFGDSLQQLYFYDLHLDIWSHIRRDTDEEDFKTCDYNKSLVVFQNAMYMLSCSDQYDTDRVGLYKLEFTSPKFCKNSHFDEDCGLDYGKILVSGLCTDVEFLVGEKETKIEAHIAIVAARSQWLRASVRDALAIQKKSVALKVFRVLQIKVPKIVPKVFQMLLNYIYTNRIDPPKGATKYGLFLDIMDLYSLAVQISWQSLEHFIIKQLTDQFLNGLITSSNVLDILSKADNMGLFSVKEYCLKFIANDLNYEEVVKSKKFEGLDTSLVVEIVRSKTNLSNESSATSVTDQSSDVKDSSIVQDMEVFFKSIGSEFSDVTLLVGGYLIPAHKCILAARCSYFEAMLRSFNPPDNIIRIQIGEMLISKNAFDVLLKYIYYGDLNIPIEHSFILFLAADFYGFSNNLLQELVKDNVKRNATFEQMVKMLEEAHLTQQTDLKKFLLEEIVERCPNISSWPNHILSHELWLDIVNSLVTSLKNVQINTNEILP